MRDEVAISAVKQLWPAVGLVTPEKKLFNYLTKQFVFQVWFSNRRARLRKHAGSIVHSVGSLPLTTCQYTPGHELGQIPGGIPQVPTTLHQGSTTLHPAPTSLHQVSGSVAQMASSMAQVPTSMSSALHSHVALSGHLGSLSGHASGMQLGQVPGIQPPAAHGAPTTLSHNSGMLTDGFLIGNKHF